MSQCLLCQVAGYSRNPKQGLQLHLCSAPVLADRMYIGYSVGFWVPHCRGECSGTLMFLLVPEACGTVKPLECFLTLDLKGKFTFVKAVTGHAS